MFDAKDPEGHLSPVFWRLWNSLLPPATCLHDNTNQSNTYDLNVGLFVGIYKFGQTMLLGQPIVVGEKTQDFELQFQHWLRAPTVLFTDACPKATKAALTVFPTTEHFWCYWRHCTW